MQRDISELMAMFGIEVTKENSVDFLADIMAEEEENPSLRTEEAARNVSNTKKWKTTRKSPRSPGTHM